MIKPIYLITVFGVTKIVKASVLNKLLKRWLCQLLFAYRFQEAMQLERAIKEAVGASAAKVLPVIKRCPALNPYFTTSGNIRNLIWLGNTRGSTIDKTVFSVDISTVLLV